MQILYRISQTVSLITFFMFPSCISDKIPHSNSPSLFSKPSYATLTTTICTLQKFIKNSFTKPRKSCNWHCKVVYMESGHTLNTKVKKLSLSFWTIERIKKYLHNAVDSSAVSFPHTSKSWLPTNIPKLNEITKKSSYDEYFI